jgi:hypothetical protein
MKFGIVPIHVQEFTTPELLIPFVQRAEALGYESVWTAKHVIIPKTYTSYWNYYREGVESLAGYEELGVHRLLINVHALRERTVTVALERFAAHVIATHG